MLLGCSREGKHTAHLFCKHIRPTCLMLTMRFNAINKAMLRQKWAAAELSEAAWNKLLWEGFRRATGTRKGLWGVWLLAACSERGNGGCCVSVAHLFCVNCDLKVCSVLEASYFAKSIFHSALCSHMAGLLGRETSASSFVQWLKRC